MTWFEILTMIGGAGIGLGVIKIIFHIGKIAKTLEMVQKSIESMEKDIKNIDGRLNRLEGAFFERGQWEARSYKMAKDISNQNPLNALPNGH